MKINVTETTYKIEVTGDDRFLVVEAPTIQIIDVGPTTITPLYSGTTTPVTAPEGDIFYNKEDDTLFVRVE